jgi:RNA 2',3'-cyclic 3'-phosphodiesterase
MRLFVAVDPGPSVAAELDRASTDLRAHSPNSKWVAAENCHITLVFLGQIDDEKLPDVARAVEEATRGHAPLTLRFKGGGGFGGSRKPRVLWVGVEGDVDALAAIQKDVEAALVLAPLGVKPEDRAFKPHITLARARNQGGDAGLLASAEAIRERDFGEARIQEIIVYKSDLSPKGPRYTAMARAPLGGSR